MTQKPVERFKSLNFSDRKGSAYAVDGFATEEELMLKGSQSVIPPTGEGRGWVRADCFKHEHDGLDCAHVEELDPGTSASLLLQGQLPSTCGWPRGWPYRGTDMGPMSRSWDKKQLEIRGTTEWYDQKMISMEQRGNYETSHRSDMSF